METELQKEIDKSIYEAVGFEPISLRRICSLSGRNYRTVIKRIRRNPDFEMIENGGRILIKKAQKYPYIDTREAHAYLATRKKCFIWWMDFPIAGLLFGLGMTIGFLLGVFISQHPF
jgi:hypothetical protein